MIRILIGHFQENLDTDWFPVLEAFGRLTTVAELAVMALLRSLHVAGHDGNWNFLLQFEILEVLRGSEEFYRVVPHLTASDFQHIFKIWLSRSFRTPGATFFIMEGNVYFDADGESKPQRVKLEPEQLEKFLQTDQEVKKTVLGAHISNMKDLEEEWEEELAELEL